MRLNLEQFIKLSDKDKIAVMNAINTSRTRRGMMRRFKGTVALKRDWRADYMEISMKPIAEIPFIKKESTIAYEQVLTKFNEGSMDKAEIMCEDAAASTMATALRRVAETLDMKNVGVFRFGERVVLVKIDKQSEAVKAKFAKKAKKAKK